MSRSKTARGEEGAGEDSPARAYLQVFLQEHATNLQAIICGYVVKMGLATGQNVTTVAAEVFQDAVLETLTHAERFNPAMQPNAWFLGIAANILKRHRASFRKRNHFEVLTGNLAQESEQDVLDRLMDANSGTDEPEQTLLAREGASELLSMIVPEDAQLLHMALVQGWDASALAQLLGITPGAARVRVHRALGRLRVAWRQSEQRKERGGYHG